MDLGRLDNPVLRLETLQVEILGKVLSRAFYNETSIRYLMPDEEVRRALLPWFFSSVVIRASQLYGEIYTTANIEGGALWISPGRALAFRQTLRTGIQAVPFKLGRGSFKRWISLTARVEEVHKRLAAGPHWYLAAHGVESSKRRTGIAGALIEPVLSRADSDGLACYLETFDERALPFYEERGFRIVGAGRIPAGGPNFWALMKRPRAFHLNYTAAAS
jgi:GNAT superfamily N-acetyltransferase